MRKVQGRLGSGARLFNVGLIWSILSVWGSSSGLAQSSPSQDRWWPDAVEASLAKAETNRLELAKALQEVSVPQRPGLQFLIENMPTADLQTLSAPFLLEHVTLAYSALESAPWGKAIPREIFLNDILPYASVTERREAWRKSLVEISRPLVANCKTAGEAALALNQKLFPLVKVRYSTARKRPDQGPLETMESGIATCTGLSILLVDACRSVGVPARVVGTPMWANKRGNHTWVEIWDGDWHFLGAAEPDPTGLDRGWFIGDAKQARKDVHENAIYATSFKQTDVVFPLPWTRHDSQVYAFNVTERYAPAEPHVDATKVRLLVNVLSAPGKSRIAAKVRLIDLDGPAAELTGLSKDESADTNDILAFDILREHRYLLLAEQEGHKIVQEYRSTAGAQDLVVLSMNQSSDTATAPVIAKSATAATVVCALPDAVLKDSMVRFFSAKPEEQARWPFTSAQEEMLTQDEASVRQTAWEAYRLAPIHQAEESDYAAKQVRSENNTSPYTLKEVGVRPTNGWALFIAMHGGGGAPKEVNDSQWKVMQQYYRDHPEVGGYLYLALRAPNDTWNGFYDSYVYPLIGQLIQQFILLGDVNPDKVFLMGYSHGGYGAFAIGPKMPDRFAAIHASAAAPTEGETSAKTLRQARFTFMIGENDHDYGRVERCRKFNDTIEKLRAAAPGNYPVTMELQTGFGHRGLPDRDKIVQMYPAWRNPVPRELTWELTDTVNRNFYWLRVPAPGKGQEIEAICHDNQLRITSSQVAGLTVFLDSRLVDVRAPLKLNWNRQVSERRLHPSLTTLCRTLQERGDPNLAFTVELPLSH